MTVSTNDLNLLANDCFESLVIDYSTNNNFLFKQKELIVHYLKSGEDLGLNEETKRLIKALSSYVKYQMETRTQSVSSNRDTPPTKTIDY